MTVEDITASAEECPSDDGECGEDRDHDHGDVEGSLLLFAERIETHEEDGNRVPMVSTVIV